MAEIELKPCPFCSSEVIDVHTSDCGNKKIQCAICGASTDWLYPELAIEAWNRRADDE